MNNLNVLDDIDQLMASADLSYLYTEADIN